MTKKYYKDLDLLRLFACIAVLLYHLNIIKGGYLAVCTFFVLTGYLSCKSAFKNKKFQIGQYYLNRLTHIYLPLIIVVFISIFAVSLLSINWLNLKPETFSVIFGYNNFWQLGAKLDYFARHVSSPFMHFWYIGILLQFELVFPFIFMLFKKMGDKLHKLVPCIILGILAIASAVYFYLCSTSMDIMPVYYGTFTRMFSIIFGLFIGFIHCYYKSFTFKNKILNRIIFFAYLIILTVLCLIIDDKSEWFALAMLATTIITCRLISYGTTTTSKKLNILDKFIKGCASISYEVYLFQYPVYFAFQNVKMDGTLKITAVIAITILLSFLLHFALNFKSKKKRPLKYIILALFLGVTFYGFYQFVDAKDHTKEMKQLEELLNQNAEVMQSKQEEYAKKLKEEEEKWAEDLSAYDDLENKIAEKVKNLPIICIGDSVMLGASDSLYNQFPNAYVDARVSRTDYEANPILSNLKDNDMLGEPILIHLGTNGECGNRCRNVMMETIGDKKVFWVTVTNDSDVHINAGLKEYVSNLDKSYIIDWENLSKGHSEYFYADGIHLNGVGRKAYTEIVYNAIYDVYYQEALAKKEEILKKYQENQNSKTSFYGNDLLLNAYDEINHEFKDVQYITDKSFDVSKLKEKIKEAIDNNTLTHKLLFVFDESAKLTTEDYQAIINLCEGSEIYIVNATENKINVDAENVTILDFYSEIKSHDNYLMVDNIHLSNEGNNALSKFIKDNIK